MVHNKPNVTVTTWSQRQNDTIPVAVIGVKKLITLCTSSEAAAIKVYIVSVPGGLAHEKEGEEDKVIHKNSR
jgi:hypothetical protein